jgi:hypothetical protein
VIWRNRHLIDLGPGKALDVNHAGVAVGVGTANLFGGHAMLWRGHGAKPVRLPEPAGATTTEATGINDSGMIVGTAGAPSFTVGVVWSARAPLPHADDQVG